MINPNKKMDSKNKKNYFEEHATVKGIDLNDFEFSIITLNHNIFMK
jgi:hypothetical protein